MSFGNKVAYYVGLGLLGLVFSQSVYAGAYKVEVLVFSQKMPNSELFEQTQSTLKPPLEALDISVLSLPGEPALSEEPLSGLSEAYAQMAQQPIYEVLYKKAWIHIITENLSSPAAHIQNPENTLNGYIHLMTNGAMTIHVDVEYMPAKDNHYGEMIGATPLVYRLTEKQPLKFNEMHYFDHPVVGVITLVTPL